MTKTLVIILAETREAEVTFNNFKMNVLDELKADLCVCIGIKPSYDYTNPMWMNAKYKFTYNEPVDYSTAFDEAFDQIAKENKNVNIFPWRNYLQIRDQFLGGVLCDDKSLQHDGSAGILIFFRWFLLQQLKVNGLLDIYDRFIITRSDFVYELPHPSMNILNKDYIWVPNGEQYGGVTDRHVVLSKTTVEPYLNIFEKFILEKQTYFDKMKLTNKWNLEQVIKFHLEANSVFDKVKFFPYIMYSVRSPTGTTRWSKGSYNDKLGLYVKYKTEYDSSHYNKNLFLQSKNDNMDLFYMTFIK